MMENIGCYSPAKKSVSECNEKLESTCTFIDELAFFFKLHAIFKNELYHCLPWQYCTSCYILTCTSVALQTNPKLYLNLLELEYSGDVTQNEAEILACFDRALQSPMAIESRLLFCQRKVEFLEDFGSDINV